MTLKLKVSDKDDIAEVWQPNVPSRDANTSGKWNYGAISEIPKVILELGGWGH